MRDNWTYELNNSILYVKVEPGFFTIDLLPSILSQIFTELLLPQAERIETIEIIRRIET